MPTQSPVAPTPAIKEQVSQQVAPPSTAGAGPARKPKALLIGGPILAILAVAGVFYYLDARHYEATDDAFIEGRVVQINPKVDGYITELAVEDNQRVKKGDVLVRIDSREQEASVANARAAIQVSQAKQDVARAVVALTRSMTTSQLASAESDVAVAEAQLSSSKSRVEEADADVAASLAEIEEDKSSVEALEADVKRSGSDLERYESVESRGAVSQTQLDSARWGVASAKARLDEARHKVTSIEAELAQKRAAAAVARNTVKENEAKLISARAALEDAKTGPLKVAAAEANANQTKADLDQTATTVSTAELNLSYTVITAPADGRVTRKQIEKGAYVQKGQALFAIVSDDLWVNANFKETQLADMKPGQEVTIHVDAFPKHDLTGKVDSIQAGTGARFSLLPPENATGNFIKVVQRVPVKIALNPGETNGLALGPGMSVVPSVKVR